MKLSTTGVKAVLLVLGLILAHAAARTCNSGVCPQIWREVLHLPHHSSGAEQERLHVQAAWLSDASRRDGRHQSGA